MVNASNAKAVFEYLTAHPKAHDQSNWVAVDGRFPEDVNDVKGFDKRVEKNVCGTTLCAAGAAVFVVDGKKAFKKAVKEFDEVPNDDIWVERGAKILGLSTDDANSLFFTSSNEYALGMLKALSENNLDDFHYLVDVSRDEGEFF